jgi:chaperonin GroES
LQYCHGDKDKINLKPLADRIVVKPAEAEEKTAGGIILPDTAKEKPIEGTVVAVGPGKVAEEGKAVKMEVKVGDKVLYGKYSGTEVTLNGEEYLIMRESDIFAILS